MNIANLDHTTDSLPSSAESAASEMTPADLADLCESRAVSYGLLARLYRAEIDEELLTELIAMHYPVHTGNNLMDEGYYKMAKYLSNEWVDPLLKLAVDFSKAFLGSGIDTYSAAYPFESVYTSEKRLLMQDARDEVKVIYRANGLDKAESWTIGEDHIAVEFEFMRILSARAAKALRSGNMDRAFSQINTQRNFLAEHIATWVPVFTADARSFAGTLFYEGLADLTEGFVEEEARLLSGLIDETDGEADLPSASK